MFLYTRVLSVLGKLMTVDAVPIDELISLDIGSRGAAVRVRERDELITEEVERL